ncbi:unnamed protein product [Rhizopus stolonifer]
MRKNRHEPITVGDFIRPVQSVKKPKVLNPVNIMDNLPSTNEKTQEAQLDPKATEQVTEDDSDSNYAPPESDKGSENEKMYSENSDKDSMDLDKDEPSGSSFARYIRSLPYDLLAVQETHASSHSLHSRFDQCLQVLSSTWNQHCGLLSFNPMLIIEPLWSSIDGRLLVA